MAARITFARSRPSAAEPGVRQDGRATLVVPFPWVGDVVKAHSLVRLLLQRRPDRPVDILVPPHLAPLVEHMPQVRSAVIAPLPKGGLGLRARIALARRLRDGGYGQAFILPGTIKAALAPFLAGVPRRTGWIGEARFGLLTDIRFGEHRVSFNERIVRLGLDREEEAPAVWPAPQLVVRAGCLAAWQAREGIDPTRPLLALAPGSNAFARRWPVERFAALARLAVERGYMVSVLGGAAERDVARVILAAAGPSARDYTGTPLGEAVLQVSAAAVVVANDSGLLHVAAAAGTPTVGIFGASDAALTGPIGAACGVVQISLPCRPCYASVCPLGHHGCMTGITVDQVFAAIGRAPAPRRDEVRVPS